MGTFLQSFQGSCAQSSLSALLATGLKTSAQARASVAICSPLGYCWEEQQFKKSRPRMLARTNWIAGAAALLIATPLASNAQLSIETAPRGIRPPPDLGLELPRVATAAAEPAASSAPRKRHRKHKVTRPRRSDPEDSIADQLNAQELDRILQSTGRTSPAGRPRFTPPPSRLAPAPPTPLAPAKIETAPRKITPPVR
jgi:hypothetical protein